MSTNAVKVLLPIETQERDHNNGVAEETLLKHRNDNDSREESLLKVREVPHRW